MKKLWNKEEKAKVVKIKAIISSKVSYLCIGKRGMHKFMLRCTRLYEKNEKNIQKWKQLAIYK